MRFTYTLLFMVGGLILSASPAPGEGNSAPPMDLGEPAGAKPRPEYCRRQPCSPGCRQQVNCEDYDKSRDTCAEAGQQLVDWTCEQPCSCAADGQVICSVSYRCADPREKKARRSDFRPPRIQLAIPLSVGLPEDKD